MNELMVMQLVQCHLSLTQLAEMQTRYVCFSLYLSIKPTSLKRNIMSLGVLLQISCEVQCMKEKTAAPAGYCKWYKLKRCRTSELLHFSRNKENTVRQIKFFTSPVPILVCFHKLFLSHMLTVFHENIMVGYKILLGVCAHAVVFLSES